MGVLLMLMTIGGLLVAGIFLVVALIAKKVWLAKFTLGSVAVWLVFYSVMLIGFSMASTEKTLAMNEPKSFCGFYLDCHLHAKVTNVQTGDKIFQRKADGRFYAVTVEVYSDARNPNIWFRLLEPKVEMIDGQGNRYSRNQDAEFDMLTGPVALQADIRSSQTLKKELVFDIPRSATDLRLDITEGYGIDKVMESVLIGDEDSILHKHVYFEVQEQKDTAGVK